jgi:hypothetical protein
VVCCHGSADVRCALAKASTRPGWTTNAGKVTFARQAKELAGRLETVRFHTAKSFKIRGRAGKVTAYTAGRPLKRWSRL